MSEQNFDIVVLGGGSGGYAAALRAVELGFTVGLVEKDKLGGTCLHRGCIPTKALLHAAEVADDTRESARFGVRSTFEGIDVAAVTTYREGIVARKFKGLQGLVKARGITVIAGEGRLVAPNAVQVGDDRIVGKNVILATGSYSRSLPGLEIGGRVITSEQALELDFVPGKVAVSSAAASSASSSRASGSPSAPTSRSSRRSPTSSRTRRSRSRKQLERAFRKRGIEYSLGMRFQGVTQDDNGVVVTLENGETVEAELLLVAVGRGPVTQGLGYDEVGVTMDRGFVITDERLAHQRPRRLRRRRHRPRPAARAPRLPAGHLRRRGDRRPQPDRRRGRQHPQGHLLRSRGRVRRLHRGEGRREVRRRPGLGLRVQPRRQRQERDPRARAARSRSFA